MISQVRYRSRWGLRFFGLTPNDKDTAFLNDMFLLTYHCGLSYTECYSMPIAYRDWFKKRLQKELEDTNKAQQNAVGNQNKPAKRRSI